MLRGKLADLESKLEQASERKMPSVTNEWIVTECKRCGRDSHMASGCYAKKHIEGYELV